VADSGRLDLDKNFARFRTIQIEFDDFEWLLRLEGDGGACFQVALSRFLLLGRDQNGILYVAQLQLRRLGSRTEKSGARL
jgi:hypothetical protein